MIQLNFETAERLVFQDPAMRRIIPAFSHLINQYALGLRIPALKSLGQRSIIEFLEKVEPHHLAAISSYLHQEVVKEDLDFNIVKDVKISKDELCEFLCDFKALPNFTISRSSQ